MKKLVALTSTCLLVTILAFASQTSDADQKWLQAVEKKVSNGDTKVSTAAETRLQLLKDWAGKNGYSAKVTRTEKSFQVELSKSLAQK
jgi:hypothetical protein